MSYEEEQRRLLALFEEAFASDNEQCSSDDEGEINQISERSQDSDTEQECSDDEHEPIISISNRQFYIGCNAINSQKGLIIHSNFQQSLGTCYNITQLIQIRRIEAIEFNQQINQSIKLKDQRLTIAN
ncbi:hypothetical protein FQR65_LT15095 [Abscondita terminalis]|nr:hypothetical protein FQR65_LT15095 [Abscondita terminalis]